MDSHKQDNSVSSLFVVSLSISNGFAKSQRKAA